jgi:hypothetical protein
VDNRRLSTPQGQGVGKVFRGDARPGGTTVIGG